MIEALMLIAIIVVTFLVIDAFLRVVKSAIARKKSYEKHVGIYHQKAMALLNDGDTPEPIIETLSFLNERIDDSKSIVFLVAFLLDRTSIDSEAESQIAEQKKIIDPFFEKRPELRRAFDEAFASAIVAIFMNGSGFRAAIARWVYYRSVRLFDAEDAAFELRARSKVSGGSNHVDNGACAA
jgi:hypothetical protein